MQNQNGIQGAETPVCDESAIAANPDYAQWHHRLHIEGHKNEASCDVSTDFRSTHDMSPSVREALRLRRSPADTPGAICLSSSSHFALVPLSKLINPVALPPGRAGRQDDVRCDAEQHDELAPFHSITSSARASN